MEEYKVTAKNFLKDIKDHELTIKMDNGMYRHLYCADPKTICQSFNIVTTPGYLIYYGDMGSFTFSRTLDMFTFFRCNDLSINEGYWAEKLTAVDRCGGYKEFVWEEFESTLREYVQDEDSEENNKLIQDFISDELMCIEQDEWGAVNFVRYFNEDNELNISLQDFFECTFHTPTTRYIWCCYAIVWAIQKYDGVKHE